MPSSAVQTFSEPDAYAAAIRATKAEVTVNARGKFSAKLAKIDLHRLWMQRFSENMPRVAHHAFVPGAPSSRSAHTLVQTCLERCGDAAGQHHATQRE